MKIFGSATRIVLLMFSVTVCMGFLQGKIGADIFIATATLVLGAYFGDKGKVDTEREVSTSYGDILKKP